MTFEQYKQVMPAVSRYLRDACLGLDKEETNKIVEQYKIIHDILWNHVDAFERAEIQAYWVNLFKDFGKNNFREDHV